MTQAIEIRERPIVLKPQEVRGILDGTLTQLRRAVAPDNSSVLGHEGKLCRDLWKHLHFDFDNGETKTRVDGPNSTMFGCGPGVQYLHVPAWHPNDDPELALVSYRVRPLWEMGDRLWVQEGWARHYTRLPTLPVHYRADLPDDPSEAMTANHAFGVMFWKPAEMMEAKHSRIHLEVTAVGVERNGNDFEWCVSFKRVEPVT